MDDEELLKTAALYGARGVWNAAWDAAIQAVRHEADQAHEFEESLYRIVSAMGFTGAGAGKQAAILAALTALETRTRLDRTRNRVSDNHENGGE